MQDVIEGKDYSFPKQEEKVLKIWSDTQAFQQQLKRSEGKKPYVFYDGPPFATGLPHYGHLLAGTLKVSLMLNYGPASSLLRCLLDISIAGTDCRLVTFAALQHACQAFNIHTMYESRYSKCGVLGAVR